MRRVIRVIKILAARRAGKMSNRRQFLKELGGAAAGALLVGTAPMLAARPRPQGAARKHAPVMIGGKRVKIIDVHAHCNVPGLADLLKGTPLERAGGGGGAAGFDVPVGPERIAKNGRN